MVDPEYPNQKYHTERWYFCLDCSRLCRYLIPAEDNQTQRQVDAEHGAAQTSRAWEGNLWPTRTKGVE